MSALGRWTLLIAGCALVISCGSGSTGGGKICTEGQQSSPGAVGDPCPQTNTDCANSGKPAYALCTAEGVWGQCVCQSASTCGNGKREGDEQCDGADLGAGSCAMVNGSGTVMCDPTTCMYDTSLCTSTGTGGNGGS